LPKWGVGYKAVTKEGKSIFRGDYHLIFEVGNTYNDTLDEMILDAAWNNNGTRRKIKYRTGYHIYKNQMNALDSHIFTFNTNNRLFKVRYSKITVIGTDSGYETIVARRITILSEVSL